MQITYKTLPPCCRKAPTGLLFGCGDRDTNLKHTKNYMRSDDFQSLLVKSVKVF